MPKNWKTYKLGEVLKVKHGYAFKGEHFTTQKNENLLLTPGNFEMAGGIKFNWGKQKFYNGEFPKDYILIESDLVIAMTDLTQSCDILGAPIIIKDSRFNYLHNQRLGLINENKELISKQFLYHYFNSNQYRGRIVATKTGSTVSHTAPERVYDCDINLPPLQEQKAIASILSALDDKIELNLQMNKTLEEMAMALYKHWFVDFGPFQNGNFVDSELGMIPEGWEVKKLEDILEVKYGKDHKKLIEGLIPVYGTGGIMRYVNQSLYDKESILIPRKGSLNNLYYLNIPFWTVDTLFYSKIKIKGFGKYAFHFLKTLDLAAMDVGSAIPSLTTQLLNRIKLVIPPNKEVMKYDESATIWFNSIQANIEENQNLTTLRNTLLPKLISGDIRIKDAEDILAASL